MAKKSEQPVVDRWLAEHAHLNGQGETPDLEELDFEEAPEAAKQLEMIERITERDPTGKIVGGVVTSVERDPGGEEKTYLYFGNPYEKNPRVVRIETHATPEEVAAIKEEIIPMPEAFELLTLMASSYRHRQPLLIEGPTSIGKTYLVDRFAELVHGRDARPYDFYCVGQTDVSELTAKWVPDTSGSDKDWRLQYGAIPKAMGTVRQPDGTVEHPGEREGGSILHIQEVGLAEPSVIDVLLGLRGEAGSLAKKIRLWDDGGADVESGRDFWLVMTTNPPESYPDRNEVDPALARGVLYVRRDELSNDSLHLTARHYLENPPLDGHPGIDAFKEPGMVELLGSTLTKYHDSYRAMLESGEKGRRQRIPAVLTDLARVVKHLHTETRWSPETAFPDVVATLREGVHLYYLERLADAELQEKLARGLDEVLTGDLGRVEHEGKSVTFAEAVEEVYREASEPVEQRLYRRLQETSELREEISRLIREQEGEADHLLDRLAEMDGTLGELLEAEDVRAVIKFNNELRRLRHEALPGFRPTEYEEAESSVEGQKAIPGPDGSLIVLERQRVVLYGPDGGEPKQLIESDGWLRDVAWAGNYVAAAPDWSSDVFVHDLQSGETKRVSSGGQDYFGAVDVTTDGKVVGGGDEGRIVVWAARSGEQLNSIRVRSNRTSILKVSPDGKSVLVGGERETNPAVYKLDSDGRSDEAWSSNAINYGEAALLEDGRVLVAHNLGAGNSDNTIRIFSGKPGEREEEPVTEYEVFEDYAPITSLTIDSKGRYAIAGSNQSSVLVAIDLENGERTKLHEFDRHVEHVTVDASGELYVKLADSDALHKLQPKLG